MVKIQNTGNTECWWGCRATRTLIIAGGNKKWYSHFGKQFVSFLQNYTYSYHTIQRSCSLVCTLKSWKLNVHTKSCTQVFIVKVKVSQSCPTLCDTMYYTAHGILQARMHGYPFPSPEDLPNPGIEPRSPTLQVDSLAAEPTGKPKNTGVGSLPLSPGGLPNPEIKPGSPALQVDSLPTELSRKSKWLP